jgi:hypothetical protein
LACIDSGCDLTGCDIDREYYGKAAKRIAEYQSQKELFEPNEIYRGGGE